MMKKSTKSVERLHDMIKNASRKRKLSCSPNILPPAKRTRLSDEKFDITQQLEADKLSPEVKLSLPEEALEGTRAAEQLIEEITKELASYVPIRHRLITRLSSNSQADDIVEVKVVQVKRRSGWRKK